jgi:hypothetical protein
MAARSSYSSDSYDNHGFKVDFSGKSARRRYPNRDLPTILSGETSSLHSSEYGIFFGESTIGDSDDSSATSEERTMRSDSNSGTYESMEELPRDATSYRSRSGSASGTEPSMSSDYSSGSSWNQGTELDGDTNISSRSDGEDYSTSRYSSNSDSDSQISIYELDSVLDSVLSATTSPSPAERTIAVNETGRLKSDPIIITTDDDDDSYHEQLAMGDSFEDGDQRSLPLEGNIDTFTNVADAKDVTKGDSRSSSKLPVLDHVRYDPGFDCASSNRDLSTVKVMTKYDTHEAFHLQVPKVLACDNASLRDDVSSIDNRSLKERLKDMRRPKAKSNHRSRVSDEELGHTVVSAQASRCKATTDKNEEMVSKYDELCGGRSGMEVCFLALIIVSLFTLIILIAILVAKK